MKAVNFKKEVSGTLDEVIARVTVALKDEGFGILTRIDFHDKIREKIGKTVDPTVILGACNPNLAYEAFQMNHDVTSVLPCNAVVRQVAPGRCSVELARPTAMMEILGDSKMLELARSADTLIERSLGRV